MHSEPYIFRNANIKIRNDSAVEQIEVMPSFKQFLKRSSSNPNKIIQINVGGTIFQTYRHTLSLINDSRLALLSESNSYYDSIRNEYFFDRDPVSFLAILNYYRTGKQK